MSKYLIVIALSGLIPATSAIAQDDAAIGGEDTPGSYDEKVFMPVLNSNRSKVWTSEDSLRMIPAHGIYGDWNTETIFTSSYGKIEVPDTAKLILAYDPCDHFIPTCGVMTSKYGMRHGRPHKGVDIRVDVGDPIVAAFDGMVRISRYSRSFGHVVVIRHSNGLESLYAHLSKRSVKPGDMVEAGEKIGQGGNTGRSSGAHLHFELRYLGRSIDPALVFDISEGDLRHKELSFLKGRPVFDHDHDERSLITENDVKRTPQIHIVGKGDTLYGLGLRYGISVTRICQLNGIRKDSTLRIGKRLTLADS